MGAAPGMGYHECAYQLYLCVGGIYLPTCYQEMVRCLLYIPRPGYTHGEVQV